MTMDENGQVLEGDDDSMNGNWEILLYVQPFP